MLLMRYSTLALAVMVLLGVGLLQARVTAQKSEDVALNGVLGQRTQIDFGANATPNAPPAPLPAPTLRAPTAREAADLTIRGPIDCGMPVIKGDPNIDPQIVKPLPADGVTQTLIVIHAPRCPDRARWLHRVWTPP